MKLVIFVKSFFGFLIFIIFNFIIKFVALNVLSVFNSILDLDTIDKVIFFLLVFFLTIVFFVYILFMERCSKKSRFQNFGKIFFKYKLQIFLWITLLSLSIFSGLILFLYPIIYYYFFKTFLKKYYVIKKYYLDFKSVKKYMLIFFIIEFPLVLLTFASFFDSEADGGSALFFMTYYILGNFYFYLPFFILSWLDDRKLKMVK